MVHRFRMRPCKTALAPTLPEAILHQPGTAQDEGDMPTDRPFDLPSGVAHLPGRIYRPDVLPPQALDLFWHPQATAPCPLVIWIHGGGWQAGSRLDPHPALFMLEHGFAVASIDYRLSHQALFPAQIEDCKAAVRWLRTMAPRYRLDDKRFGVWGASAGGHLAALLGTAGSHAAWDRQGPCRHQSSRVQAVCDWFGPVDLLRMNQPPGTIDHQSASAPEGRLVGGPVATRPRLVAQADPRRHIDQRCPPFLIMHGERDQTVVPQQSRLLTQALKQAEVPVTTIFVPDAGHGFDDRPELLDQVLTFFDRSLKRRPQPSPPRWHNPRPVANDPLRWLSMPCERIGGSYTVATWTPAQAGDQALPLLLYLHGMGSHPANLRVLITRRAPAIASGHVPPCTVACPIGLRDSLYCDSADGQRPVASIIIDDLLPWLHQQLPLDPDPRRRVIAGFSMGGFGALRLGLSAPRSWGGIWALGAALHSPQYLRDHRQEQFASVHGNDLGHASTASPWTLARQGSPEDLPPIALGCGERDELLVKNLLFAQLLSERGACVTMSTIEDAEHDSAQLFDGASEQWQAWLRERWAR